MALQYLLKIISFYISTAISYPQFQFFRMLKFSGIFVTLSDTFISLYFLLCSMSPCTIDLDDQTTLNFWVNNRRQFNRPNLVLIHGYGWDSRLQFLLQVRSLSQAFNLYMPDLLFFGKSRTNRTDRSDVFQAKCIREGLKKLGLDKYNLVGLSYGGFVAYNISVNYGEEVEKVVIVSSGIFCTEEQREEQSKKIGRNHMYDLLLPKKPQHFREMIELLMYKNNLFKWVPDFIIWDFIDVMVNNHRKEKLELVKYMMDKKADRELPLLSQESLIIWGEKDNVFPVYLAYQFQRHLGSKSRVEIIKETGHAVNLEPPVVVNRLITSFVSGGSAENFI